MSIVDKYSRFWKYYREIPEKSDFSKKKYSYTLLRGCSERFNHVLSNDPDQDVDEEDQLESTGLLPYNQSISLKEINDIVKQKNIDESEVFFTSSMSEDYLCLEVAHIKEMSDEEKEDQYKIQCEMYYDQRKQEEDRELLNIKYEMENLQRRADKIANKNLKK